MIAIVYKGDKVIVMKRNYSNGRLALELVDKETAIDGMTGEGSPYGVASVNLVDENVDEGWLFLDQPNMPGIYETLLHAKIVSKAVYWGSSGFNRGTYPLVKYLK